MARLHSHLTGTDHAGCNCRVSSLFRRERNQPGREMGGRNGGWTVRPETPYETVKIGEIKRLSGVTELMPGNAIEPCAQSLHAPSQQSPPQPCLQSWSRLSAAVSCVPATCPDDCIPVCTCSQWFSSSATADTGTANAPRRGDIARARTIKISRNLCVRSGISE